MCLAMYLAAHVEVPEEHFRTAWQNNPDGGGYAFIDDENEIIVRRYLLMEDWLENFHKDRAEYSDRAFIVHFRMATHGDCNLDNTHPVWVNENTVMIHNGIINVPMDRSDQRSDTRVFAEEILAELPTGWLDNRAIMELISDYVGWSRLIFLTTDPNLHWGVYFIHEYTGQWAQDGKVWYSNDSYKKVKPIVVTTGKAKSNGQSNACNAGYTKNVGGAWDNYGVTDYNRCTTCRRYIADDWGWCSHCEACTECGQDAYQCECWVRQLPDDTPQLSNGSIHDMTDTQVKDL